MNELKHRDHPWRKRSREFSTHLATLPPAARRQIVAAEKAYVSELHDPASPLMCATRDYLQCMVAPEPVDEETPVA